MNEPFATQPSAVLRHSLPLWLKILLTIAGGYAGLVIPPTVAVVPALAIIVLNGRLLTALQIGALKVCMEFLLGSIAVLSAVYLWQVHAWQKLKWAAMGFGAVALLVGILSVLPE